MSCDMVGMENLDSGVGVYAPDAESYSVFADLFDPIICDYHTGFKAGDKHPSRDFGDVETLGNLDPEVRIASCLLPSHQSDRPMYLHELFRHCHQ